MDADPAAPIVIGVDTGGTFTDVFASSGRVLKVPSTPANPVVAILDGLRTIGVAAQDAVGHGTTVATNAVLERTGARTALLTTAGFEDVLEIRRQNRPALYDLLASWPEPLVPRDLRIGLKERLDFEGNVLQVLELDGSQWQQAFVGVEALAICLLFSYVNATHEEAVAAHLRELLGDEFPLSLSSEVAPRCGEYERSSTTVVNAYVMPMMQRYLRALTEEVRLLGPRHLHVMHSNGGLLDATAAVERPVQTVLSGPAAGVVGARELARRASREHIITFDMGGTSTDVAVVTGALLESGDGEVASFPLLIPMLRIETVGAGGGSIARVDQAGGLHVGPRSAGADPGPAAYGRGVEPTVTDANLVLGRLSAAGLLGGTMPLDVGRARTALQRIAVPLAMTIEQVAWSIVSLTNANMGRAVRTVTLQRGHDPRRFTLFPFGGAGPLHAAELAESLGISEILIPPHPGVMAALGLTVPDMQRDFFRTVLLPLTSEAEPEMEAVFAQLETQTCGVPEESGLFGKVRLERALDLRYAGQTFELRVPYHADRDEQEAAFSHAYQQRYGTVAMGQPIEVVQVRLRAVWPRLVQPQLAPPWPEVARDLGSRSVWFGSAVGLGDVHRRESTVWWRPSLPAGTVVDGPGVMGQYDSSTLLPPDWGAAVDEHFNLIVTRCSA